MDIRLDGKKALVTGASSGIGSGIALALAEAGADVAINYRNNGDGAEETAAAVRERGRQAILLPADVGHEDEVEAMFASFDDAFGEIDILVSNAGHGAADRPIHETTWQEWDRLLRSNLHGPFLCGRAAAQRMVRRGAGGRIINISSVHEEACNTPNTGPYCVSKGGLRNLTRAMALELGPLGITVNDVAPGMILTPLNAQAMVDTAYLTDAEAQITVRRVGLPADVAHMVVFLCSEQASYCNGGTYLVDGGWMLDWPQV